MKNSTNVSIEKNLIVPPDRDGWRLDRFLRDRIPRLSRNRIQKLIHKEVKVHYKKTLKASSKVRCGDQIIILRPSFEEPETPTTFEILYEDDALYIIDKPAGLPVHPTARYYRNTLTFLLRKKYGPQSPILTHRLDRETSGILLCAKSKQAERNLKKQFESRKVSKEYLAIVHGALHQHRLLVNIPLGPALHSDVRIRQGPRYDELGLPAQTEIHLLESFSDCTLIAAKPLTGRQHQIRAHLEALGHPLVGDKIYGLDENLFIDYVGDGLDVEGWSRLQLKRHALHAHSVEFLHPITQGPIRITSPLPADLVDYIKIKQSEFSQ